MKCEYCFGEIENGMCTCCGRNEETATGRFDDIDTVLKVAQFDIDCAKDKKLQDDYSAFKASIAYIQERKDVIEKCIATALKIDTFCYKNNIYEYLHGDCNSTSCEHGKLRTSDDMYRLGLYVDGKYRYEMIPQDMITKRQVYLGMLTTDRDKTSFVTNGVLISRLTDENGVPLSIAEFKEQCYGDKAPLAFQMKCLEWFVNPDENDVMQRSLAEFAKRIETWIGKIKQIGNAHSNIMAQPLK